MTQAIKLKQLNIFTMSTYKKRADRFLNFLKENNLSSSDTVDKLKAKLSTGTDDLKNELEEAVTENFRKSVKGDWKGGRYFQSITSWSGKAAQDTMMEIAYNYGIKIRENEHKLYEHAIDNDVILTEDESFELSEICSECEVYLSNLLPYGVILGWWVDGTIVCADLEHWDSDDIESEIDWSL